MVSRRESDGRAIRPVGAWPRKGNPGSWGYLELVPPKVPALLTQRVMGGIGRWGRVGHAAGLEELGPRIVPTWIPRISLSPLLRIGLLLTMRAPHKGDKGAYLDMLKGIS